MPETPLPPHVLSPRAALSGYLRIVHGLYMEDRLDVALQAAHDAFETAGWPAGAWTEFYNTLQCEADARAASNETKLDDILIAEIPREGGDALCDQVRTAAREARKIVADLLEVQFKRPCLIAVLLPDAPLPYISASRGYMVRKNDLTKICVPYQTIASHEGLREMLVHEFTHVACYEITDGERVLGWLGEGLAQHVSGRVSDEKCIQLIRSDRKYDRLLSIDRIQGALSSRDLRKDDPDLVRAGYDFAGSLVERWVHETEIAKVRHTIELIGAGWNPTLAIYLGTKIWMPRLVRQWRRGLRGLARAS